MAAFDTPIAPTSATPADTNNATLFTASAATSVLVDVANLGAADVSVRVGITPSGGSVHWKVYDLVVPAKDAVAGLGPYFLRNGDAITVRTDTADDVTFSVSGLESS